MKLKNKTARIVTAVTAEELKDFKLLAGSRFMSMSALARQVLCEQIKQFRKMQAKERAA